jgi:hypothetical protein
MTIPTHPVDRRRRLPIAPLALGIVIVVAGLVIVALGNGLSPAGATPGSGAVVDGFPLGGLADQDQVIEAFAAQALDQRMPGHAAVQSATAYREDSRVVRSGTMTIYLFHLTDGSYHAAGVYCGVPFGPPTGLPGDGCRPSPLGP